ncbi:MAG: hypothetical protein BroJett011_52110 [Chloroflexota bacterium]|nr:MAG: hypothetical protein BroJett011_52110 [Chloroflexota bacterium]
MTGWVELPLGELAQLIRGVCYPKIEASSTPRAGYLPILRATNIRDEGLVLETDLVYVPQKYVKAEQHLQPGDIIIGMSSGSKELVGKAAQLALSWPGACGAFCAVARCKPGVEPKFVGYFFRSKRCRQLIQAKSSGININNLRYTDLEQLPIPVPSLAEQQCIATAIERRFARLEAGTVALRRIQAKLSRYKAAVLQAAVTGRLVPPDPADEPAADLPNSHPDLPPLPEGWYWASLAAIADVLAGYAFKSAAYSTAGFQIVRIGNVERGKLNLAEKPIFVAEIEDRIKEKYLLKPGDILITLTGSRRKRDYGFVAMVGDEVGLLLNQRVARLRFQSQLNPRFFLLALQGDHFQDRFFQYETGNVGQGNVRIAALIREAVPVPPLAEQARIVAEVDRRFAAAGRLEAVIQTTLARAEQLRQAILARAFTGQM